MRRFPGPVRGDGRFPAFTLVEIMVVVALVGVIVVAGLAPIIRIVERLSDVRDEAARRVDREAPVETIFADALGMLPAPTGAPFRVVRADRLDGTPDDTLIVYGRGAARRTGRVGSTAYRTFRESIDGRHLPGLYRFDRPLVLAGRIDPENLRQEEGILVSREARGLRLSVLDGKDGEWKDEYEGKFPEGFRVRLVLKDKSELLREDLFPGDIGGPAVRRSRRGFILVAVLMASTVLLSAATALALLARARSRTVAAETFRLSARAAAESALREAAMRLKADSSDVVSRLDPLFDPTKPLELERAGMRIRVRLDPLDDRIPLKGLFLPDGSTVRREYDGAVRRLFQRVGRPELADRFLDGLDRDKDARPGGGEASGDIDRVPSDLTELLAIPGIDAALLRGSGDRPGLAAGLTVYGDEKINLNVAEPLVLGLLDARFDEETAKALVYARGTKALESLDDLKKIPAIPADALARIANALQFGSSYFRVTIQVRRGAERRLFVAVLHRSSGGTPELVSWEE